MERPLALKLLGTTKKAKFRDEGLWHGDPGWRNVALVRNLERDITKVLMIDLEPRITMQEERLSTEADTRSGFF